MNDTLACNFSFTLSLTLLFDLTFSSSHTLPNFLPCYLSGMLVKIITHWLTLENQINSIINLQCLKYLDLQQQCMVGNEMPPVDVLYVLPIPSGGTGHFSRKNKQDKIKCIAKGRLMWLSLSWIVGLIVI